MTEKLVYFDIFTDHSSSVDIRGCFPMSDLQISKNTAPYVMDLDCDKNATIYLWKKPILSIDAFYNTKMLDISLPRKWKFFTRTPRNISLIAPLAYIPYGAIDIRKEIPLQKKRTYPDLFRRSIPRTLAMRKSYRTTRQFFAKKKQSIAFLFGIFLLITAPLLFYIKYSVEQGYNEILSLPAAHNISEAYKKANQAQRHFDRAQFLFFPFSWIPGETIDVASRAISGGQLLASAIKAPLDAIPNKQGNVEISTTEQIQPSDFRGAAHEIAIGKSVGITNPTDWIEKNSNVIKQSIQDIITAGDLYQNVSGSSALSIKMQKAGSLISSLTPILTKYDQYEQVLLRMLGHFGHERYIIFNQNRDEVRANGGFPGSIITFTFFKGNISEYRTDDVYYYDWHLYPYKETPPPGIAEISNNYGLRDVNYYPDFQRTIQKANTFVERSGESTINTGIAIHQGLIEEILAITGPVQVEGIPIAFDSDNFSLLMSTLVEGKIQKDKTPKDVLFRFIDALSKKINNAKTLQSVAILIGEYWQRGEILMASRTSEIQNFLDTIQKSLPWNCVENCNPNWIYPIFTSIGGNKSDRYIRRTISTHTSKINECLYKNTVTLTLEHQFNDEDRKKIQQYIKVFGIIDTEMQHTIQKIQGDSTNATFIRMYVPYGAKITNNNTEISQENYIENSVDVFSFSTAVDPGKHVTKKFSYEFTPKDCVSIKSAEIIRQPGLRNFHILSE